jgi:hypothetical protein
MKKQAHSSQATNIRCEFVRFHNVWIAFRVLEYICNVYKVHSFTLWSFVCRKKEKGNRFQRCLRPSKNKPSTHRYVFQTFLLFVFLKRKKNLVWTWIFKSQWTTFNTKSSYKALQNPSSNLKNSKSLSYSQG